MNASSDFAPITILSGFIKSSTAKPSLKNSGFETTSKFLTPCFAKMSVTDFEVPTGTVLLLTITLKSLSPFSFSSSPIFSATPKTCLRSAEPSSPCGVGKHKKITLVSVTAFLRSSVKVSLFFSIFLSNRTSNPGS